MATELFTDILNSTPDIGAATTSARMWLREQALSVNSVNPKQVLTQQPDRMVTKITIGRMYLFMYDPKTKKDLPYYDRFPLIFPFQKAPDGFYGINMHYLPHMMRAKLMDNLYTLSNNKNIDDTTKLRLSYEMLNKASKFRFFKPCVKHYLNNHVKSRFLWVPADKWDTALFLPLERFVGATKQQVWRDSRRMVQGQ